jgi:hypothetical protein
MIGVSFQAFSDTKMVSTPAKQAQPFSGRRHSQRPEVKKTNRIFSNTCVEVFFKTVPGA